MPSTNAATSCIPPTSARTKACAALLSRRPTCSHLRPDDLDDEQRAFLRNYVDANVLPFLSPQIINARHPFPHLENGALYLVVRLDEEADAAGGTDASAGAAGGAKSKGKASKGSKDAPDAKADKDKGKAEKAATKQAKTREEPGGGRRDAGPGPPAPPSASASSSLPGRGLQFILLEHAIEMVAPRDILHVHRQAHQRHLRHAQRRPGCHRRLRRSRRGLPRAHEAHPEEALAPGPGAAGKRAQAVQYGRAAADEAAEPQRAPDVRDLGAARHELHLRAGRPACPKSSAQPW